LLTVVEVAEKLKCHPHTVRRWIWSHKLRAVKVGDLVRVSEAEVERFLRPSEAQSKHGAGGLLQVMRELQASVDPEAVREMEALIQAGTKAADWSDPLA
jgi:excisionase family DNA binding protein